MMGGTKRRTGPSAVRAFVRLRLLDFLLDLALLAFTFTLRIWSMVRL